MNFIVEDTKLKERKGQFSVEVIQIMMWKSRGVFRQIDGLQLGAVADFGVQNCQYTTKVDAK